MKRIRLILSSYAIFLILMGLAGYLSNPEKAKTALMSGGLFGGLFLGLAWMAFRQCRYWLPTGIGLSLMLALVFLWRSVASWTAVAGGDPEKLTAAILISVMLTGTLGLLGFLIALRAQGNSRADRESPQSGSPPLAGT